MREWWNQVYVVSVRRGFRQVTLGRWGNREGVFGGFTTAPEDYQIRRLLRVKDGVALTRLEAATQTDSWELIDEVPKRTYLRYPEKMVPLTTDDARPTGFKWNDPDMQSVLSSMSSSVTSTVGSMLGTSNLEKMKYVFYQLNLLADGRVAVGNSQNEKHDAYYLKLLPPTSIVKTAEFLPVENSTGNSPISTYTGFRNLLNLMSETSQLHYRVDYHRALDIGKGGNSGGAGEVKFRAPEGGYFYIQPQSDDDTTIITILDNNFAEGDTDDTLQPHSLYDSSYGSIGVLVTSPENPEEGRIYLFCHMEKPNAAISDGKTVQETFYTNKNFPKANPNYQESSNNPYGVFPAQPQRAIKVKAGEEIGFMGNDGTGTVAPHIHLEVWEYFEQIDGATGRGWRRVDPLSVFYGEKNEKSWIDLSRDMDTPNTDSSLNFRTMEVYLNNQYSAVVTKLHEEDDDPSNDEEKPEQYQKAFGKWYLSQRGEEVEFERMRSKP